MKKQIIFACLVQLFISAILVNISAQNYSGFNLNKYYTPDIVRNQLDVRFNTNNHYQMRNYENNDSISTNYFNFYLEPVYSRVINNRNYITNLSIIGDFNGSSNTNKSTDNYKSQNLYSKNDIKVNYNYNGFNSKKQFLNLSVNSAYNRNYQNSRYYNSSSNDVKTISNTANVILKVGVGSGRIESVEDARQAIYILEELDSKNKLTKKLSDDEIIAFAQCISKVKNKRFFDARLRKIDELTTVDSFLVSNNYLNKSDISYFTTLNDLWEYGALNLRQSGEVFALNIISSNDYNRSNQYKDKDIYVYDNSELYNSLGVNLSYINKKSIGLNWQQTINSDLNFNRAITSDVLGIGQTYEYENTYKSTFADLLLSYDLSYMPNTRTKYDVSINQDITYKYFDKTSSNSENQTVRSSTNIRFVGNYYFSPQLRFTAGANIIYNYENSITNKITNKIFDFGIGAGFTYSFF